MRKTGNAVILTKSEYAELCKAAEQKPKERLCTSKRLLYTILATTLSLTALTAIGVFFTDKDMTAMGVLTGLSWGVTATDAAVYSSKAKAENKIKLTERMIENLAEKWGIENIIEIARVVLPE